MRSTGCAGFAGAMLAGASCFLWIGASYAKTNARLPAHNHDGIYAVHVMTRLGSCPCRGQYARPFRLGKLGVAEFGLQRKVARRAAKLRYHRFRQMLLSDCWG
jgi:hypothetical protein